MKMIQICTHVTSRSNTNVNVTLRCHNQDRTKITWNPICNRNNFTLNLSHIRYWISDIWHRISGIGYPIILNLSCNHPCFEFTPYLISMCQSFMELNVFLTSHTKYIYSNVFKYVQQHARNSRDLSSQ